MIELTTQQIVRLFAHWVTLLTNEGLQPVGLVAAKGAPGEPAALLKLIVRDEIGPDNQVATVEMLRSIADMIEDGSASRREGSAEV